MLVSTLIAIIPLALAGLNFNYYTTKSLRESAYEQNQILSKTISNGVTDYMTKAYVLTEELVNNEHVIGFDSEEQGRAIKDTSKRNSYFDLFCIQDMKGNQTSRSKGKLANRADRWWFKQSVNTKKPFVSKSYLTVNDDSEAINSIIFPILDGEGKMLGVMDADLKLDELQKMVEKYSTKKAYAYIIDGEGSVIAHPDRKQVQEIYNYKTLHKTVKIKDSLGNLIRDNNGIPKTKEEDINVPEKLKESSYKALEGKAGIVTYKDLDGKDIISAYETIKLPGDSQNWAVVTVQKDAFAGVRSIQYKLVIFGIVLLIVVIVGSYIFSSELAKPLVRLSRLTQKAAKGDLTVISEYKYEDEIGELSNAFNIMINNMKNLIRNIKEASEVVSNSSESLLISTQQTSSSITEVASAISGITTDMESGTESADLGVKASNELSKELDLVVNNINESKESSNKVYEVSNKGFDTINMLELKNEENRKVSKDVANVISSLSEKTNNIGMIVETINSISEQTNLLALNAAIEAARAGEAGKGFSVVAEEVRKLSVSTADSTNSVKTIINNIQRDIEIAKDTIRRSELVVSEQNKAVDDTRDSFKGINLSIENIVEKINSISNSLNSLEQRKSEVVSVTQNILEVTSGISDATQNVCGATEEQNAEMEEINSLSEELNRMAKKLTSEIEIFKVS